MLAAATERARMARIGRRNYPNAYYQVAQGGDMTNADARWVKVAPGPGAKNWPDCLAHGYIRVGWGEVGDLRTFPNEETYRRFFEERYPGERASQLWTRRSLQPGDQITANRGKSEILAVGTVREPGCRWPGDMADFNHAVDVDLGRLLLPPRSAPAGLAINGCWSVARVSG